MLSQLRRGHRAWPMFELKSGAAMAAPAAPMPPPLYIRVHPLHTSVFNLERCNGEGWLLSSGDDHILAFSTIKLQKVIVTEVVNIHL